MDMVEFARELFEAAEAGDVDRLQALIAPDAAIVQNGVATTTAGLLAFNRAVHDVAPDLRYLNAVRSATADGFVEEHVVSGTAGGESFRLPACVVGTVEAGVLTSLREYADMSQGRPLLRALRV